MQQTIASYDLRTMTPYGYLNDPDEFADVKVFQDKSGVWARLTVNVNEFESIETEHESLDDAVAAYEARVQELNSTWTVRLVSNSTR